MELSKECIKCGKIFHKHYATSINQWNNTTKYCSRKCFSEARKNNPQYPGYWKGKHIPLEVRKRIRETNKRKGIEPKIKAIRRGEANNKWKGGRWKTSDGYIMIQKPNYPSSTQKGYIMEHRFVMENNLNRYLEKWEYVHHKNGIKDDNRIENLEVVVMKKHFGVVRCPYCIKEFLIK